MAEHETPVPENRQLSDSERELSEWMLRHGNPEAEAFLTQLSKATVSPWKCACGCASINFEIVDMPPPTGGLRVLGDYQFKQGEDLNGIFIFEQDGVLAGIEVFGLSGAASSTLPSIEQLNALNEPRGR